MIAAVNDTVIGPNGQRISLPLDYGPAKEPLPKLMIGADPEFFVFRNGHFISGHTFECGTKKEPMATKHGSIQVDGVALECNVTPASTRLEFVRNVMNVVTDLRTFIKSQDKVADLVIRPYALIGAEKMRALPDEVKKLGCEQDFNAYTGTANPRPKQDVVYRTAAGHVHLGWTEVSNPKNIYHMIRCRQLARQLDYYLGVPSLDWDESPIRRRLYGQAGCFRSKPYGIEYRVLSNVWLRSPKITAFVFDQAKKAFERWWAGENLDAKFHGAAYDIINKNITGWRTQYKELAEHIL